MVLVGIQLRFSPEPPTQAGSLCYNALRCVVLLVVAGIYQWTPFKQACLATAIETDGLQRTLDCREESKCHTHESQPPERLRFMPVGP